jgi:hypothetical protein
VYRCLLILGAIIALGNKVLNCNRPLVKAAEKRVSSWLKISWTRLQEAALTVMTPWITIPGIPET